MKTLAIVLHCLVNGQGKTDPHCSRAGDEVRRAIKRIRTVLEPLGVQPVLECRQLDRQACLDPPAESNRIWIAGQPLALDDQSREGISEELLVRAGIKAGIRLLEPGSIPPGRAGDGMRPSSCGSGGCCY